MSDYDEDYRAGERHAYETERKTRVELDAAVSVLLAECNALLKGAVVHAPTLRKHVKRVRELMKKAGV